MRSILVFLVLIASDEFISYYDSIDLLESPRSIKLNIRRNQEIVDGSKLYYMIFTDIYINETKNASIYI